MSSIPSAQRHSSLLARALELVKESNPNFSNHVYEFSDVFMIEMKSIEAEAGDEESFIESVQTNLTDNDKYKYICYLVERSNRIKLLQQQSAPNNSIIEHNQNDMNQEADSKTDEISTTVQDHQMMIETMANDMSRLYQIFNTMSTSLSETKCFLKNNVTPRSHSFGECDILNEKCKVGELNYEFSLKSALEVMVSATTSMVMDKDIELSKAIEQVGIDIAVQEILRKVRTDNALVCINVNFSTTYSHTMADVSIEPINMSLEKVVDLYEQALAKEFGKQWIEILKQIGKDKWYLGVFDIIQEAMGYEDEC